ncbi:hypothetical protein RhiJN_09968 [Ceratobasidium sp. AG-Ba]|nr:hypothetical protein RhiJN_09968 [Ceratobasidium sp. AG-Ba]
MSSTSPSKFKSHLWLSAMSPTTLNLATRLFAFSALMVLLGVVAPANALALDPRAIVSAPSLNLTALDRSYILAPSPSVFTAHPTSPPSPPSSRPTPAILAHIVDRAHRTQKWITDIQYRASHALCRGRPPFVDSRLASHVYYAIFVTRLELCPPGTSLIESLPRPRWNLPVRRPAPAVPMLPPPATPTIDEMPPTRAHSRADGHFPSPRPAHLFPKRPLPVFKEESEPESTVEYRPTLVQELVRQAHLVWTWVLDEDMMEWYMFVFHSLVKLGMVSASVYIGWFMDFKILAPWWVSLRVSLSDEPEVVARYEHFLVIHGYRASSPRTPFFRKKFVWNDSVALPDREKLERRKWKKVNKKIARYKDRYAGRDDVVFKVYVVRSWGVHRRYQMFDGRHKFEVPDKDNRGYKLFTGMFQPTGPIFRDEDLPRFPPWVPRRTLPKIRVPSPLDTSIIRPKEKPQTYYWELEIGGGELYIHEEPEVEGGADHPKEQYPRGEMDR